jgi:CheY-like chemotaxis protein
MASRFQADEAAAVPRCALVADDDATMRDILSSLLTGAGYTVHLAASGRQALSLASNFVTSVAIIDLAMPDGNGLQLCSTLRTIPSFQYTPIIVLTHYPIGKALKAALRAGASGFVCKPLVPSELLWCLDAQIAKMAAAPLVATILRDINSGLAAGAPDIPEELLPPVGSEWILSHVPRISLNRKRAALSANASASTTSVSYGGQNTIINTVSVQSRVLVCERDPTTRELIRQVVVVEGHAVKFARDAQDLLSLIVTEDYDLVLMNICTSGVDHVIKSIRALKGSKASTQIVIITKGAMQQQMFEQKCAGISGYLTEPITKELLVRCLLHHLQAKISDRQPERLVNVNLELNIDTLSRMENLFTSDGLARFFRKLSVSIQEILSLLDKRTVQEAALLANLLHNLAGTAGTLGCIALSAFARELEGDRSELKQQQFIEIANATLKAIAAHTAALVSASVVGSELCRVELETAHALHVLVVDDAAIIRDVVVTFLHAAGHKVTCADGGRAAIIAVTGTRFDVVLMDVRMPEMDGLEATRRIRALGDKCGRLPIVALTAGISIEQIAETRSAGMDSHLSKPFDQKTLLAAVACAAQTGRKRINKGLL